MIVHVLPGDAVGSEFAKANLAGDVIVCREVLVAGPLDGDDLDEFWDVRSNFIALDYGGDPIEYREYVAYEMERLLTLPENAEVNLWFEYELFCQANMWFCLDLLKDFEGKVFRVEPLNASPDDVWKGFGKVDAGSLPACFDARTEFSREDIETGSQLWAAFRRRDSRRLLELGEYRSPCFPFLKEVCDAAAEIETRPQRIIEEIRSAGLRDVEAVFPEFQKRAGVYGFGDLQVERLLAKL